MTETELIDRLREAIVLDGPDAWRNNGYLNDAMVAGLTTEAAGKRASEVSQEVGNNTVLFQNIQARIARMTQPSRSHLMAQDLAQIVNAARALNLSPDFVRNRWVPAELAKLKPAPTPPAPPQPPVAVVIPAAPPDDFAELLHSDDLPPVPVLVEVPTPPVVPEPLLPPVFVPAPVFVPPVFIEPAPLAGPAPVVKSFTATPATIRRGDSVTLEWEVENLLAVTIDDVGQGLSPKNRGWIKPAKTADYTLFDANNNPLSTVRVEVIPRDNSGLYGVLFALALLGLIYWFIRSNNNPSSTPDRKPEKTTRQKKASASRKNRQQTAQEPREEVATSTPGADNVPVKTADVPVVASAPPKKTQPKNSVEPPVTEPTPAEPVSKPSTPADARTGKYEEAFGNKPYDKVELGTDEQGWRRARANGRWGYINEADEWVIEPEYDAVTPFRGNTAAAFLNGKLITINRQGEQVRK